jgi:hypothetical protein
MSRVIAFPIKKIPPPKLVEYEILSEWKIIDRGDGSLYAVYTGETIPGGFDARALMIKASLALAALHTTIDELNSGELD